MKTFFKITTIGFAILIANLFLTACDQQTNPVDTGQITESTESQQVVLEDGPLTAEQIEMIKAPQEKIYLAEKDLKILKSKSGASLQKQFVTSWFIPLGASGWAYTGDELHGKCWLYFPSFAMNQTTTITMDWESTGFLEGGAEFSPHGVQFNYPVTVWISYKDTDLGDINEQDLKIWYFNEDTGLWELIGDVVDTQNKMVGGQLHHFSRYAIGTE